MTLFGFVFPVLVMLIPELSCGWVKICK